MRNQNRVQNSIFVGGFLMPIFFVTQSHASSVTSNTTAGSGTLVESLQFENSSLDRKETERELSFNAGFSYSHTSDTSTTPVTTTNNPELSGGLDYKSETHWRLGGGLSYGWAQQPTTINTPIKSGTTTRTITTGYSKLGGNLYAGHTFKFGAPKKMTMPKKELTKAQDPDVDDDSIEDSHFYPSLGIKGLVGFASYKINDSRALAIKAGNANVALPAVKQSNFGFELSGAPTPWLSLQLEWTKYKYSGNPSDFINSLESAQPRIQALYSGLVGAVSGLPDYIWSFSLTLTPIVDWEFEYEQSLSRSITDLSFSRTKKGNARYEMSETWKLGAGAEFDTAASGSTSTLGLAEVSYSW